MKVLVLDFDGLIVDSSKETFAVAYNTYQKLYGFKKISPKRLDRSNFGRIRAELKDVEGEFTKTRPFCSHVCNFSTILSGLDKGLKFKDQKSFDDYRRTVKEEPHYRKEFHDERERIQRESMAAFLKLSPPHKSVISDIKRLMPYFDETFIATGNRKDLVRRTLSHYKLGIPPSRILDADFMESKKGMTKRVMIEHILETTKAEPKNIVFADDQLMYIEAVLGTGVKVFIVDWGIDTHENRKAAEAKGAEIISQHNFYSRIKEYVKGLK